MPKPDEIGWDTLLERRCVVVLGEAQSGKSTELKAKCKDLKASEAAWFVEVADLAKEMLHLEGAALEEWTHSTSLGWFFLDSVDDADLQNLRLNDALRRLKNALGESWSRARVVVSCRGTDWNPKYQMDTLRDIFSEPSSVLRAHRREESVECAEDVAPEGTGADALPRPAASDIVVVQLAPLGRDQVRRLASAKLGAQDALLFVDGLFSNDLHRLATRPGDVLWFSDYWRGSRAFGELHQILGSTVEERLREFSDQRERHATTTPEQLVWAAERAAAATYLCAKTSIRVPSGDESSVDATGLFPDLQPPQVRELLGRAVFDVSTYGRVRFHHRAVREFLAGRWLARMVAQGHPVDEMLAFLYAQIGSIRVPIASRGSLSAWLAGWIDEVRDVAVESSPLQLMLYGDPALLPLESRRKVLQEIIREHASGHSWRHASDDNALRRFAHPDLESTVLELLSGCAPRTTPRELIDFVRVGRYRSCFETLLARAADPQEEATTRVFSVRAVAALVRSDSEYSQVAAGLRKPEALEPHVVASMIEEFHPKHLDHDAVLAPLLALSPQEPQATGPAWQVAQHLKSQTSRDGLRSIVTSLATQLGKSADHAWLWSCLGDLAVHLIKSELDDADWVWLELVFDLSRAPGHPWHQDMDVGLFREALRGSGPGRRHLLWRQVDRLRSSPDGAAVTRRREIPYPVLDGIEPTSEDIDWLLRDVLAREDIKDQLLALDIAMHCGLLADEPSLEDARGQLADHPPLLKRINRRMEKRTKQPQDPWHQRMARVRKARATRKQAISAHNKTYFLEHLGELTEGEFSMLWWLSGKAKHANGRPRWGKGNLDPIRAEFGDEVFAAARAGFLAYWRTNRPLLPHERKDRNRPENGLIVGLTGLAMAHEDAVDWAALNSEEARIAARYACGEINGFPAWFDDLAAAWPDEVGQVLRQGLRADYASPDDEAIPHDVLAKVTWASPAVKRIVAPLLISLVQDQPSQPELLSQAVGVITDAGEPWVAQLHELVRTRVDASALRADLTVWWPILFKLVPAEGTLFLTDWLQGRQWSPRLREMVAALMVAGLPNAGDVDGVTLATLCRLAYRAIRPEEDIDHPSRVAYCHGPRDEAKDARSRLVRLLEEAPGSAHLLEELASEPYADPHREWLLAAAGRRLSRDAEPEPLSERQVFELEKRFAAAPRTSHQLYDVALARLANVARDMERGTFSMRALFWSTTGADGKRKSVHEAELQKWLAHELRLRSRGHYSVAREPEEDDMNRPDIRLSSRGIGPVSIELKWADNWTARELEEAVTDQLIGKYMRDRDSRYGILVLARTSKPGWRPPGAGNMTLSRLLEHLQYLANETVRHVGLGGVSICGIDFAPPSGSTAEKRRDANMGQATRLP